MIVSCVVPLLVANELGLKVQEAPEGRPLQLNEIAPAKPPIGLTVIVVVLLLCPATAETEAGLGESENPGALTVKLTVVLAATAPEVPLIVTVVVPAGVLLEV